MDDSSVFDWSVAWRWPREKVAETSKTLLLRAREPGTSRLVAIKQGRVGKYPQELVKSLQAFEAAVLPKMAHPGIVRLLGVQMDLGLPVLMLEWLDGKTLLETVYAYPVGSVLPLADALPIFAQVARALQAAHAAGVIHGDVHPNNIMLDARMKATLFDFGLGHLIRSPGLTNGGTGGYRAPEKIRGGQIDERVDQYSLGLVLYFLLSGQHAFHSYGDQSRLVNHMMPPFIAHAPDVINSLIARMTQHEPDARFPSLTDMLAALPSI